MKKQIEWKYVKKLRESDEVDKALRNFGVKLPEALKVALAKYNGGRPDEKSFDTEKQKGYVFNSLYSYNAGDANQLVINVAADLIKKGMYPVGIEAAGNAICFNTRSVSLVLFNHEENEQEKILISSNRPLFESLGFSG